MSNEQSAYELQYELNVLLEEYKDIRSEIGRRVLYQVNVLIYGIPAILAVAASLFTFADYDALTQNSPLVLFVIFAINFVSFYLGMFIILQDEVILTLAGYQEVILKPRLSCICKTNVLSWHDYKQENLYKKEHHILWRVSKLLVAPFSVGIFYVICLGSFLYLLYLQFFSGQVIFSATHILFLIISFLTLVYFTISLLLTGIKYNKTSSLRYDQ